MQKKFIIGFPAGNIVFSGEKAQTIVLSATQLFDSIIQAEKIVERILKDSPNLKSAVILPYYCVDGTPSSPEQTPPPQKELEF